MITSSAARRFRPNLLPRSNFTLIFPRSLSITRCSMSALSVVILVSIPDSCASTRKVILQSRTLNSKKSNQAYTAWPQNYPLCRLFSFAIRQAKEWLHLRPSRRGCFLFIGISGREPFAGMRFVTGEVFMTGEGVCCLYGASAWCYVCKMAAALA